VLNLYTLKPKKKKHLGTDRGKQYNFMTEFFERPIEVQIGLPLEG